jgi:hypothetical protein
MKKLISYPILLITLLFTVIQFTWSQDKPAITPYIQLQYFKNTENVRILKTTLTYSLNRMELPLPGLEVSFYSPGTKNELLGTAITDNKGAAKLELTGEMKIAAGGDGKWPFNSEFRGNDSIEAASADLSVKDVTLEVTFTEPDSIKTVSVKAYTFDNGKEVPVTGEHVLVYVPRMFSLLPIGDITLDDTGNGSLEFPTDLPGNKEGTLTVITRFEENENFGNVEKVVVMKWGVPTEYSVPTDHRALWTKTAPKWMIYTLSILLAGVWGHYLFAIISLIRIRLDAKKQEALDNYGKVKKAK